MTDPDLLIPIKQRRVNERDSSDLRELQPSPSDSHPASLQPVSETTTSESSVSLPSSPSGSSSTESTSTSGTDSSSSSSETSSKSSPQPSSNASSPERSTSASSSQIMSPELLEKECYFNTLLTDTREKQGHAITRSQMDNLREQQQHITILKQVTMQLQNQLRPVSAPPAANMPLPPYPQRRPSDMESRNQVQPENANAPCHKNSSDSETRDRLQDINEEPQRCIGPSCVKELAKFFPHHQMRRITAMSTPGQDERDSLRQKRRREGVVKSDKHCNLTFKLKLGPLRTVLCFPEISLWYFYWCLL